MNPESFPQPEVVSEKVDTGKKVYKFLEKTKFLEVRKSDEQFDEWIQELSYEDYSDYLTRLNGILREIPIKDRSIDGANVEVSFSLGFDRGTAYLPPYAEQKEGMMRDVFNATKEIKDNKDRALLSYYALQSIHPYSDGNGRTGRLLYEIISDEGKELTQEKLSGLLNHNEKETGGGRYLFAKKVLNPSRAYYFINREVTKDLLGKDFLEENGKIFVASGYGVGTLSKEAEEKMSPDEAELTKKILSEDDVNNFPFRGITLLKLISEREDLQKYLYWLKPLLDKNHGVVPEDIGKRGIGINSEELMPNLTEDDAQRLREIHKEVKERFIDKMIDIFVNPEEHQIEIEGEDVSIKEMFHLK